MNAQLRDELDTLLPDKLGGDMVAIPRFLTDYTRERLRQLCPDYVFRGRHLHVQEFSCGILGHLPSSCSTHAHCENQAMLLKTHYNLAVIDSRLRR